MTSQEEEGYANEDYPIEILQYFNNVLLKYIQTGYKVYLQPLT